MSCVGVSFASSSLYLALLVFLQGRGSNGEVASVAWGNFSLIQQGEWMLEFYAPWCPACQQFTSTWENFESKMEDRVGVGKVDVTVETTLSGRFMVTQLPSIFHIKDGAVRLYSGDRTLSRLMEYIDEEKWTDEEPVPFWKSPTAYHMQLVGTVFWLAEVARETQVMLEQDYQMPTYAIFILVALSTIVFGLGLGGIAVCLIEVCLRLFSRGDTRKGAPPRLQSEEKEEEEDSTQARSAESSLKEGVEDMGKPQAAGAGEAGVPRKRLVGDK